MDNGVKFWKWSVVLLALCNVGLLAAVWLKSGNRPLGDKHEMPRDIVIRNLKMTAGQVQQYDALIRDHRKAMNELEHNGHEYRRQLYSTLSAPNAAAADSLEQLIAANQRQIEKVTYDHFKQVRAICSDDQKAIFDRIIGDVIQRMSGPHGRPPGGPGGPGGPDGPPPPGMPPPQ